MGHTGFAVPVVMAVRHLVVEPDGHVRRLLVVVRVELLRLVQRDALLERVLLLVVQGARRDLVAADADLDVAGPPDDDLLVRRGQGADAADHRGVAVPRAQDPLRRRRAGGRRHGRLGGHVRGLDGGRLRRAEHARAARERGGDGQIVADVEDAPGELEALRGVLGLEPAHLGAHVIELDVGEDGVGFCEAVHGVDGRGGDGDGGWLGDKQEAL